MNKKKDFAIPKAKVSWIMTYTSLFSTTQHCDSSLVFISCCDSLGSTSWSIEFIWVKDLSTNLISGQYNHHFWLALCFVSLGSNNQREMAHYFNWFNQHLTFWRVTIKSQIWFRLLVVSTTMLILDAACYSELIGIQ